MSRMYPIAFATLLAALVPVAAVAVTPEAERPVQIETEENLTCARTDAGRVFCWGAVAGPPENLRADALLPSARPVAGVGGASHLAVGAEQACAIVAGGQVLCWRVRLGKDGRLALTQARPRNDLGAVTALDLAGDRGCAAGRDGRIRCWQGRGKAEPQVELTGVQRLAVAGTHACAQNRLGVWCWGEPGPELGGRAERPGAPVRVADPDGVRLASATALVAAERSTCAASSGGPPHCWGRHPRFDLRGRSPRPLGGQDARAVALSPNLLCLSTTGGQVRCRGDNAYGQLGTGQASDRPLSRIVPVAGLDDAVALAVGRVHACALRRGGEVVCWGGNTLGQLGDGTQADRTRPRAVVGLPGGPAPAVQRPFDARPLVVGGQPAPKPAWLDLRFAERPALDSFGRRYRPSWYRDHRRPRSTIWSRLEVEAAGIRAAVIASRDNHWAIHRDLGLLGPLQLPGRPTWIGLDGDDAVYLALADGTLHRAGSVQAALSVGGFAPIGRFEHLRSQDVSVGLLALVDGDDLYLSTDGGGHIGKVVLEEGLLVRRALTRHDGVLVVQGQMPGEGGLTLISKDRGQTFFPSAFEPTSLSRTGPWIMSSKCPKAVLGVDPEKWFEMDYWEYGPSLSGWRAPMLGTTWAKPLAVDGATSQAQPAPPAKGKEVTGADGACGGGGGGIGGLGGGRPAAPGCGVACLRSTTGAQQPASGIRYAFTADADCDAEHGRCGTGQTIRRRPHLAIASKGQPKVILPVCAQPRRLFSTAGIGLVLCETPDGTSLYALDAQGRWAREASLGDQRAEDLDQVLAAPDGTLLLLPGRAPEGGDYLGPAWIRSPASLGENRWRSFSPAGALTIRALPGGRALLVKPGQGPDSLSLFIQAAAGPPEALLQNVAVDGDAMELYVEPDGRLRFVLWMTTRGRSEHFLTRSGHFVPVEDKSDR